MTSSQDFTTTEGSTLTVTLSSPTGAHEDFVTSPYVGYWLSNGSANVNDAYINQSEELTLTFSQPISEVKISVSALSHNNIGQEEFRLKVNGEYHAF